MSKAKVIAMRVRLLQVLQSLDSRTWDEEACENLGAVTAQWTVEVLAGVCERLLTDPEQRWVTLTRLRQIAAEVASPRPSTDEVYAEIMNKATRGLYQVPHPDKPNILLPGPPPMSCEFVRRVLERLRPWADICSGEANRDGGLYRQIQEAHKTVTEAWDRDVIHAISGGACDPVLFAPYTPWAPEERVYQLASEAKPKPKDQRQLMPAPEEFKRLRKRLVEKQP